MSKEYRDVLNILIQNVDPMTVDDIFVKGAKSKDWYYRHLPKLCETGLIITGKTYIEKANKEVKTYQYAPEENPNAIPTWLGIGKKLEDIIALASIKKNIAVSKAFLKNIPVYINDRGEKLCPYLTGLFRTFKIFVDPNGDLSLCSRVPIGNVMNNSIEEMMKTEQYSREVQSFKRCPGCWMACFVEIMLAAPRPYQILVRNR